ncbi:hypothetical protein GCM10010350_74760 [Streptomyces galilaeus]|nr:hypothetical protein GCM10010350_74760 [Streptomyces galilaeus]
MTLRNPGIRCHCHRLKPGPASCTWSYPVRLQAGSPDVKRVTRRLHGAATGTAARRIQAAATIQPKVKAAATGSRTSQTDRSADRTVPTGPCGDRFGPACAAS